MDMEEGPTPHPERGTTGCVHGSAYLSRRSLCHAKSEERLVQHLELQRCYQNFVRRHSSLRFGKVTRTPAMQAGLAKRALTFREIFLLAITFAGLAGATQRTTWIAGRAAHTLAA